MTKPDYFTLARLAQATYHVDEHTLIPVGWIELASQICSFKKEAAGHYIGKVSSKVHSKKMLVGSLFYSKSGEKVDTNESIAIEQSTLDRAMHMVAYYNAVENSIVIAFRGTDFANDIDDIWNDLQIASGITPERVPYAAQFVDKAIAEFYARQSMDAEMSDAGAPTISLVGHSLGGTIAHCVGLLSNLHAVAFDSPGIPGGVRGATPMNNLVSILSYPNIFNSANPHLGQIFHIPVGADSGKTTHVKLAAASKVQVASKAAADYYISPLATQLFTGLISVLGCDTSYLLPHLLHLGRTHSMSNFVSYLEDSHAPLLEIAEWYAQDRVLSQSPLEIIYALEQQSQQTQVSLTQ